MQLPTLHANVQESIGRNSVSSAVGACDMVTSSALLLCNAATSELIFFREYLGNIRPRRMSSSSVVTSS
jgi:hypothetical protein